MLEDDRGASVLDQIEVCMASRSYVTFQGHM